MDNLFQKQYRMKSSRLPDWDYAVPGRYFVTIYTQDHKHYFSSIKNGKMHLNPACEIAETEQDLNNLRHYTALNPENLITEVIPHA